MSLIYEKRAFVTVTYNPTGDYILFDWFDLMLTLDEIRASHDKALSAARRHNCRNYVYDQLKAVTMVSRPEVAHWWGTTWAPVLAQFGLRALVRVLPPELVANGWHRETVDGLTVVDVGTRRAAEEALARV